MDKFHIILLSPARPKLIACSVPDIWVTFPVKRMLGAKGSALTYSAAFA